MLRAWAWAPRARSTPACAMPTASLAGPARAIAESRERVRSTGAGAWVWAESRVVDNSRNRAQRRGIDRIRSSMGSGVGRQGSADPSQEVPDELVELEFRLIGDEAGHDVPHD